jgi:lipopolysaccharide biosynthesis glycosyltransferase
MFIPSILGDLDKVLYLDSDVLVRKDLVEYFNQLNINENYDMAVIKDLGLIKIWTPSFKVYEVDDVFYSGQMLMNLKNLRGVNGIDHRFINLLNSGKYDISYGDE